jgi:acetamidase/formamidase
MSERPRSIHSVRDDAFNYAWDNSFEAALEVESGAELEFHVRDASDEQIGAESDVGDVERLDFTRVNPVSGPVNVKGARPGDALAVEILEFRPSGWGWTAIIPGFGLLADEYPEPWLRISLVDPKRGDMKIDAPQLHVPAHGALRARVLWRMVFLLFTSGSSVAPTTSEET